jgi:inner membrane protein
MNAIKHALAGWCVAELVPGIGRRERAAIVIAGIAPDIDGFGLPVELATRGDRREAKSVTTIPLRVF